MSLSNFEPKSNLRYPRVKRNIPFTLTKLQLNLPYNPGTPGIHSLSGYGGHRTHAGLRSIYEVCETS